MDPDSEFAARVLREGENAPPHSVVVACYRCRWVSTFDTVGEAFDAFLVHRHREALAG